MRPKSIYYTNRQREMFMHKFLIVLFVVVSLSLIQHAAFSIGEDGGTSDTMVWDFGDKQYPNRNEKTQQTLAEIVKCFHSAIGLLQDEPEDNESLFSFLNFALLEADFADTDDLVGCEDHLDVRSRNPDAQCFVGNTFYTREEVMETFGANGSRQYLKYSFQCAEQPVVFETTVVRHYHLNL